MAQYQEKYFLNKKFPGYHRIFAKKFKIQKIGMLIYNENLSISL